MGTSNCLVWVSGEGVVLAEPSVVAVDAMTGKVLSVGSEAHEMLGRTGGNLIAQRPIRAGVVADYFVCRAMLAYFMGRVTDGGLSRFFKPEVMVSVPSGITQVERRAVLEATIAAGAKSAYLIDQSLAAAIGAKLPIESAFGSMVVDIGGGQAGAAVVSLGGIVASASVKAGGDRLDEAIINFVRREHNLIIGERMAEEVKLKIGSAIPIHPKKTIEVKGRDAIMGLPKSIVIDSSEVTGAMMPIINVIVDCVKKVLEQTPPELASDIIDRGMVLTGGTAQLKGLDRVITSQTNVPAHLAEDSMRAVVYGTGMALENIEIWKKLLYTG